MTGAALMSGQAQANQATGAPSAEVSISPALRQALLRAPAYSGASLYVLAVIPAEKVEYLRKIAVEPLIERACRAATAAASAAFPGRTVAIRTEPNPAGDGLSDHYVIVTIPTPDSGVGVADAERRFYKQLRDYSAEEIATRVSVVLDFA